MTTVLAAALLVGPVASAQASNDSPQSYTNSAPVQQVASRKPWYKTRTAKNVGIGAAGGAAFGGLTGGRKGAAIGAMLGAGGGYVYNQVKKPKR